MKINFKAIFFIILASVLLATVFNTFSSNGIPFIRESLKVEIIENLNENHAGLVIKGIRLKDVIKLYNLNNSVFIDARDQWDFAEGHIKGAINIPEFSFDPNNEELIKLGKDELIVVYCDGDECDTSKRLANQLLKLEFTNVYVFLGGYTEWSNAELPIVKANNDE